MHDNRLKIRITATSVDGKANKHLINFVAKQFAVPKSRIKLVRGKLSRQKNLLIHKPYQLPATLAIQNR
ncbi:MAG: DUF167 domain-containing protein [Spongiibacteraceae bacterium]|nr:DUF167 domain-containing protein [Spongiibacteraceae bacterium]